MSSIDSRRLDQSFRPRLGTACLVVLFSPMRTHTDGLVGWLADWVGIGPVRRSKLCFSLLCRFWERESGTDRTGRLSGARRVHPKRTARLGLVKLVPIIVLAVERANVAMPSIRT